MPKKTLFCFIAIALLIPNAALSQANPTPSTASASQQATSTQYYKLNFVLREVDEGKVVNQRGFTMQVCTDGTWFSLRAGTKLPISTPKDVTYTDLGVNLDVRLTEGNDSTVPMYVKAEISSTGTESPSTAPPIRQVQVRTSTLAPIGKPTMLFTADDPSSKNRFELEVNPTRQK
jgi:hypothetical protein